MGRCSPAELLHFLLILKIKLSRKGKRFNATWKDKTSSYHSALQHLEWFFQVSGLRNEFKFIWCTCESAAICYSGKLPSIAEWDFNNAHEAAAIQMSRCWESPVDAQALISAPPGWLSRF